MASSGMLPVSATLPMRSPSVSYTHLDVYKRQLVCPDEARKARVLAALEEKGYLMGLEK